MWPDHKICIYIVNGLFPQLFLDIIYYSVHSQCKSMWY